MQIIYLAVIIFIIVFGIFFVVIYKTEKKEKNDHLLSTSIIVSVVFGILISVCITFIIFLVSGSVNVLSSILDLKLKQNQIIYLAIYFLVYSLTLERLIIGMLKYHFSKSKMAQNTVLSFTRILFFVICGDLLSVELRPSLILGFVVSLILLTIDVIENRRHQKSS